MSEQRRKLDEMIQAYEPTAYKWISADSIVTAQWVRMKCIYGCNSYDRHACCPPQVPPVAECERLISGYEQAVILRFERQFDRLDKLHAWEAKLNAKLTGLERQFFLAGFYKALLLFFEACGICKECSGAPAKCKQPKLARPATEALGIDVYATVRRHGFPIEVRTEKTQVMNRYAFLLVE